MTPGGHRTIRGHVIDRMSSRDRSVVVTCSALGGHGFGPRYVDLLLGGHGFTAAALGGHGFTSAALSGHGFTSAALGGHGFGPRRPWVCFSGLMRSRDPRRPRVYFSGTMLALGGHGILGGHGVTIRAMSGYR